MFNIYKNQKKKKLHINKGSYNIGNVHTYLNNYIQIIHIYIIFI